MRLSNIRLILPASFMVFVSACQPDTGSPIQQNSTRPVQQNPNVVEQVQKDNGLQTAFEALENGQYVAAESGFRSYLRKNRNASDDELGQLILVKSALAKTLHLSGKFEESHKFFSDAIDTSEYQVEEDDPHLNRIRIDFASLLIDRGEIDQARRLLSNIDIDNADTDTAEAVSLPEVRMLRGRISTERGDYRGAEDSYRKAISYYEGASDRKNNLSRAEVLQNLAGLYSIQGRYDEVENVLNEALAVRGDVLGYSHPLVAQTQTLLADHFADVGTYDRAIRAHQEALSIWERTLGTKHPNIAIALNNLAFVFAVQGQYWDAVPLQLRALRIIEGSLGPSHPEVAGVVNNLAWIYEKLGQEEDATAFYQRALEIREKALSPNHPALAGSLVNIANVKASRNEHVEALRLFEKARVIRENAFGKNHPLYADSLSRMASVFNNTGDFQQAVRFQNQAVQILEKSLQDNHPNLAHARAVSAEYLGTSGQLARALVVARQATTNHRTYQIAARGNLTANSLITGQSRRDDFRRHIDILSAAKRAGLISDQDAFTESFAIAQEARATTVGLAISKMAARFSVNDGDLPKLVRRRQDLESRWSALDKSLLQQLGKTGGANDSALTGRLRDQLDTLATQIAGLDAELGQKFPQYAELASPRPVTAAEVRRSLKAHESLLFYLVGQEKTDIWVLTSRSQKHVTKDNFGSPELAQLVRDLRNTVDPSRFEVQTLSDLPAFDFEKAHTLYTQLIEPVESNISDTSQLFIVADKALESLPFSLLVREEIDDLTLPLAQYASVPWLAKKYATVTLPSVSTISSLRNLARKSQATASFVGFGDPQLAARTGASRGVKGLASIYRSGDPDISAIRALPSLPETARELRLMAKALNASGVESFYTGRSASERTVKELDLSKFRVLAFATHGLVAGELHGNLEPGLVLSPPETGGGIDNGLLTASEIAQLKLDADLVILSACNTAAADGTPGAVGLSGLAKAFLFAGSRSLLVSHWPVETNSTVFLTTTMLNRMAQDPNSGRALALNEAILEMMNDKDIPHLAHPAFWAPFVLVGEPGGLEQTASR